MVLGFWAEEAGGGWSCETGGGWCERFEEKEPAEVFEVARERVEAKVDEVVEVTDSR